MKFQNVKVYNFEGALRGMRNPKNSWHLSDSFFGLVDMETTEEDYIVAEKWVQKDYPDYPTEENPEAERLYETTDDWLLANGVLERDEYNSIANCAFIGPNDMHLAQTLIKSGPEHRKFLRQIMVCVDITAPLYWWKEFDTYKVGTVANSTSTMHKLTSKPITLDCFEIDDLAEMDMIIPIVGSEITLEQAKNAIIDICEGLRQKYLETKDKKYWKELVRWLPNGWQQTRTVTMTYENLLAMCSKSQRRFHKLTEWSGDGEDFVTESFIKFARKLPYAQEFIFIDEQSK